MSPSRPGDVNPLKSPPITAGEALRRTAAWAVKGVPAVFGLALGAVIVVQYVVPLLAATLRPEWARSFDPLSYLTAAGILTAVLAPLALAWKFLGLHRRMAAATFGVVSLAATFFGLVMLLVFFLGLARDVGRWFEVMPGLVQARNEQLTSNVEKARNAEEFLKREMEELDAEMNAELATAATEEEKAAIKQDFEKIRARKRADAEKTMEEMLTAAAGIRHNLTAPALLWHFLTHGPSNHEQDAGIYPALVGSLMLGLITIFFAVPLGVGAAIYLEEYRKDDWLSRIIQVNINNLAGVPSIVYGILGAYVFVDLVFRPLEDAHPGIAARNLLGGGLTLAMLTLPVIIVAAQEAIRAVPVSLRHGALALGATKWQTIWHHVLPSARPGILTGTILALSRAMGEAAPLVFFGALLFVPDAPTLLSRFTMLPMQIFGWTDRPQEAWRYNAALASLVLLMMVLSLNGLAIYFRQRAQRTIQA